MAHKGDKGHDNKSCPPLDHSKSLNDFKAMGIPIYAPYLKIDYMSMNMGGFTVKPFDLTTIDGNWTHTNADGTPCPIYGFLITHPEMGRIPFDNGDKTETHIEYRVIYDDKFFEHLHLKRLVIDDKIPFPMSTFERMLRYAKYGYFPCRETKLKLIKALNELNSREIEVSKSLYKGWD